MVDAVRGLVRALDDEIGEIGEKASVGVGTPGAPGRACIGTALDLPIAARAEPVKPGETLRVRI